MDSITLNDLEAPISNRSSTGSGACTVANPCGSGWSGVWTEAKVSFLLYELSTRLGIDDLATCSALTASARPGRRGHVSNRPTIRRLAEQAHERSLPCAARPTAGTEPEPCADWADAYQLRPHMPPPRPLDNYRDGRSGAAIRGVDGIIERMLFGSY
jgi:hypothetical protein